MIHPSGLFDYQIPLRRRGDGAWYGQALRHADERQHPGLVGECPHLVLSAGVVTLTCSESVTQRLRRAVYRDGYRPTSEVVFEVGPAIERVAEDGALLRVTRAGTGDLGALLLHDHRVALAIGNVDHRLRDLIELEYDPRVDDDRLYWVKYSLMQPETHLVWLDAEHVDVEATREHMRNLPEGSLQFAVRGEGGEATSRLNSELMEYASQLRRFSSATWTQVAPSFQTRDEWVAYVRALPDRRPDDLHVLFRLGGAEVKLREGEYAFQAPWHLYLQQIRRRGVPGQHTQIGVAREHPGLDKAAIVESTERIASRTIRMA
jgi:hypothetical protein